MRDITAIIFVGTLSSLGSIAHAQAQPQECKVVVVNLQQAITDSKEFKDVSANFDSRAKEWKAKIDSIQAEFSALILKQKAQGESAGLSTVRELDSEISQKDSELASIIEKAQSDVDRHREAWLAQITESAFETAKQVATEKGFNTFVDLSSPTTTVPGNGNATNCDISAEVKTRMNAKFNASEDKPGQHPFRGITSEGPLVPLPERNIP